MLKQILNNYNFNLGESTIKKFELFLKIFKEKNSQINLSSLRDDESIIEKHFIDSLMLTKYLQLSWKIADIWTWWWFPLIPLAIYNWILDSKSDVQEYKNINDSQFYWIDSVAKKLRAIDEFALNLWLPNIQTVHARTEELGIDKNYRETFDFVVSRATAYFPTLLEYAIPLLKVWWIFIAYKMDNENEIFEWKVALIKLKSEIIYIKKYDLCWQKRSLIFVKKQEKTPWDYPRSSQLIARKPLI